MAIKTQVLHFEIAVSFAKRFCETHEYFYAKNLKEYYRELGFTHYLSEIRGEVPIKKWHNKALTSYMLEEGWIENAYDKKAHILWRSKIYKRKKR